MPQTPSFAAMKGGPDFLLIGAAKAGTTSLFHMLGQHPEVFASPVKEPNYFAFGVPHDRFEGPDSDRLYAAAVDTADAYTALFSGRSDERVAGEASHWYLYSEVAAAAIRSALPDALIVAVLRDPVERAYSTYLHLRRTGQESLPSFREALDAEEGRIRSGQYWGHYVARGRYAEQLSRYYAVFDRSAVCVVLHDELVTERAAVMGRLFEFLGVDAAFEPQEVRFNKSGLQSPGAARATRLVRLPYGIVRTALPRGVRRVVQTAYNKTLRKPPLEDSVRHRLQEAFAPDVRRLESMIGRDLSRWYRA